MPIITDVQRGIEPGAVMAYSYDSRNRLVFAEESVGLTVSASWAYAYDNASNRTQQIRVGDTGATAGTIDYGYNAANQLTSMTGQSASWSYDAAGNQTTNGVTGESATYGDRGERTAVDSVSNDYFGVGNTDRLSNTSHTFDNGALGLMHRGDTVEEQRLTRTPDGQVISTRGTNTYYFILDHLGSIVATVQTVLSFSPLSLRARTQLLLLPRCWPRPWPLSALRESFITQEWRHQDAKADECMVVGADSRSSGGGDMGNYKQNQLRRISPGSPCCRRIDLRIHAHLHRKPSL